MHKAQRGGNRSGKRIELNRYSNYARPIHRAYR